MMRQNIVKYVFSILHPILFSRFDIFYTNIFTIHNVASSAIHVHFASHTQNENLFSSNWMSWYIAFKQKKKRGMLSWKRILKKRKCRLFHVVLYLFKFTPLCILYIIILRRCVYKIQCVIRGCDKNVLSFFVHVVFISLNIIFVAYFKSFLKF